MKRIKLVHGSARVSENITNQTIEALNKVCVLAYNNKPKQCDIHIVSKFVTAKDLKCPSCKKHALMQYIDGKECTSCGYVC
jgi:hypothetical protein